MPVTVLRLILLQIALFGLAHADEPGDVSVEASSSDVSLDHSSFDTIRELIHPAPEELLWQQIPWTTEFSTASKRSRESGRPILMISMNGNLLGCT